VKLGQDVADFGLLDLVRNAGKKQEDRHKATDGEVDVETPSPRSVLGEGSPEQRTADDSELRA